MRKKSPLAEREITRTDQDQGLDLDLGPSLGLGQDQFPDQGLAPCPGQFPGQGLAVAPGAPLDPPVAVRPLGLAAGVDLPVRPGARMDPRVLRGGGPSLTASRAPKVQLEAGMPLRVLLGAVRVLKVLLAAEMVLRVLLVAEMVPKARQEVGLAPDHRLEVVRDQRVLAEARQGVDLEVPLDRVVLDLTRMSWRCYSVLIP